MHWRGDLAIVIWGGDLSVSRGLYWFLLFCLRSDKMAEHFDDLSLPSDFDGTVRLFPLRNVVSFPGIVQAFNVFEPRYRKMMEDCLESDRLIAMATVDLLGDRLPDGEPAIEPVVCVGRVLSSTKLDDGNYNLFLIGVKRAVILTELDTSLPYRLAEVEVQDEDLKERFGEGVSRELILSKFSDLLNLIPGANDQVLEQFSSKSLPLCRLVDMVCYASNMDPEDQHRILSTVDLNRRGSLLLSLLDARIQEAQQKSDSGPRFPPEFSVN